MIRVLTATDVHTGRTYYLNCMHIISIEKKPDHYTTIRITGAGANEPFKLLVSEDADKLAVDLDAALRNLGNKPNS